MRIIPLAVLAVGIAQPALAQDMRGEVYAGVALSGDALYRDTVYDLDEGHAFGFGVYRDLGAWEVGADVMRTDRTYTGYNNDVETLSLMVNGRYGFAVGGSTEGYVGLGLGAIRVAYAGTGGDAPFSGNDLVPGAQLSLGARFGVGSGWIFSELKYQKALEDASIDSSADSNVPQSYDSTSVIVGYAFNF